MCTKDVRWKQRFNNLKKAFIQFEKAVDSCNSLSDLEKEGLIQRYEYTFELSWKTLKDYLEAQGIMTKFPKEVIKESFQANFLDDGDIWMDMLEKRNMITHTYDKNIFEQIVDLIVNSYFYQIQFTFNKLLKET